MKRSDDYTKPAPKTIAPDSVDPIALVIAGETHWERLLNEPQLNRQGMRAEALIAHYRKLARKVLLVTKRIARKAKR